MFFTKCILVMFCLSVIGIGGYQAYISWMAKGRLVDVVLIALVYVLIITICIPLYLRFV